MKPTRSNLLLSVTMSWGSKAYELLGAGWPDLAECLTSGVRWPQRRRTEPVSGRPRDKRGWTEVGLKGNRSNEKAKPFLHL